MSCLVTYFASKVRANSLIVQTAGGKGRAGGEDDGRTLLDGSPQPGARSVRRGGAPERGGATLQGGARPCTCGSSSAATRGAPRPSGPAGGTEARHPRRRGRGARAPGRGAQRPHAGRVRRRARGRDRGAGGAGDALPGAPAPGPLPRKKDPARDGAGRRGGPAGARGLAGGAGGRPWRAALADVAPGSGWCSSTRPPR
jgi:hypothetical protein